MPMPQAEMRWRLTWELHFTHSHFCSIALNAKNSVPMVEWLFFCLHL